MNKPLYEEVQKMDNIWPLLLFTITVGFNWLIYFYFGYNDLNLFYVSMSSVGFLVAFLFSLRLYTRIDSDGVHYRFFPFHFSWRYIAWRDIAKQEVRQYSPWAEYGGWGMRWGKSGWACTIGGKSGLQLLQKDNKRLLIGTKNPEMMIDIIKQFKIS